MSEESEEILKQQVYSAVKNKPSLFTQTKKFNVYKGVCDYSEYEYEDIVEERVDTRDKENYTIECGCGCHFNKHEVVMQFKGIKTETTEHRP